MEFRLVTPAQAEAVFQLYREIFSTPGCAWDETYPAMKHVQEDIQLNGLYALFSEDGDLSGVATVHASNELDHLCWGLPFKKPCILSRFGIKPFCQGKGLGHKLLALAMEAAKAKGFDGMRLLASKQNPAALALYQSANFFRSGEAICYGGEYVLFERFL